MKVTMILFVLGGLSLGFSLLFFLAPKQINSRQILDLYIGPKAKQEGLEGLINRIITIDDKITMAAQAMGVFLVFFTLILFWTGLALIQ
ncbi:MAG: hypothetical protein KKC66_04330 [Candidatus Omnitrophica bacterium]|nr:hypothetical protein [Candidatus Omnitrophota bacterium]MBU1933108.1 hypothetical protein [Candidatus Omnitrophota bacterium]